MKLAEGVMIDAVFKKLNNIFHATQVSFRTGGAEAVIGALRQKNMEDPGGAVMATDLSNAYGSMSRQCALEAVRTHCPQMLGILCTHWESGSTTAQLQTASGWTVWNVERGTRPSAPAANPTFCLALHHALSETRKNTEHGQDDETRRETGELKVLAFAGDAFLLDTACVVNLFSGFSGRTTWLGAGVGEIPCVDPKPGLAGRDPDRTSARSEIV